MKRIGYSNKEIADLFNLKKGYVKNLVFLRYQRKDIDYENLDFLLENIKIEYNIEIRKTPNYKISYKLNKEEILDMYINERMTISKISDILGIGSSGVRYLLQREGLDTGLNRFNKSVDKEKIKQKYEELIKMNIKKMRIYEILSKEFNLSSGYLCKGLKLID